MGIILAFMKLYLKLYNHMWQKPDLLSAYQMWFHLFSLSPMKSEKYGYVINKIIDAFSYHPIAEKIPLIHSMGLKPMTFRLLDWRAN